MKSMLLTLGLLATTCVCCAQSTPPATYEFLTLVEYETQYYGKAKLVFAPAFQNKTELSLEALPSYGSDKYATTLGKNQETVNQQLEALTAAGWELVHVSADDRGHEFLFRCRKP